MHVMIDLETLGVEPNAAILQIGAVMFEPVSGGKILTKEAFNMYVKPAKDASVSEGTFRWWLTQEHAARVRMVEGLQSAQGEAHVLEALVEWPTTSYKYTWEAISGVWANGAAFDIPLLQSAFYRQGFPTPWIYNTVRDTRTLFWLTEYPQVDTTGFLKHDALDDAIIQAMQVQQAMRHLGR